MPTASPKRRVGRPAKLSDPDVNNVTVGAGTKRLLIEEADTVLMPLGGYVAAILVALERRQRIALAQDGQLLPPTRRRA